MISKIKEFSKEFRSRLIYELAARNCDKEKIKHVEFLGGNLISANPYYEFSENGERKVFVDPEPIIQEFEQHTDMYRGDSEKLCGHYILSLAVGEKLTSLAWLDAVHKYMRELGYDESTKYVAVIHRDTDKEHVHIVTSRVRLVERDASSQRAALGANFQLVPDSNDRHKGMDAAREIEHKYDLAPPKTDGWSKELPRFTDPDKDQAHIMRGISKEIFKAHTKPRTMSQLVERFAERGIQIRVTEKNGAVQGISYRLGKPDGRWIPGSKVMSTKLTWNALQRNGISYSKFRDDAKLGLGIGVAQPDLHSVKSDGALFRAYVNIPKNNKALTKYVRKRTSRMDYYEESGRLYLGFNLGLNWSFRKITKGEVEVEKEKKRVEELIRQALKLIKVILQSLFSTSEVFVKYEQDPIELSQLPQVALRLNVAAEEMHVADWAEAEIREQCHKQFKNLAIAYLSADRETIGDDAILERQV